MLDDFLMQWKGSSPERDSKADEAELPKEHTGVQSEHQAVLAPVTKGLEDQRRIDLEGINLRVLQKPTALNLSFARTALLRFARSPTRGWSRFGFPDSLQ